MAKGVAKVSLRFEQCNKLEDALRKMTRLKNQIDIRQVEYDSLHDIAFPLVAAAGDIYEFSNIRAQITRPTTWQVDAVKLLKKFGAKVYGMLTVSRSEFREALASNLFGKNPNLKGIAKLVPETPRFHLTELLEE